ncbi:MAG TPA: hypothetical protein VG476_07375, partial [Acidimicrobiales bacterium]|nr:hypothetical protein [Acidimicrobiales bacterium]
LVTGTVVVVEAAELELDDPQAASAVAAVRPPAVTSPVRISERLEICSVLCSSTSVIPLIAQDDPQTVGGELDSAPQCTPGQPDIRGSARAI